MNPAEIENLILTKLTPDEKVDWEDILRRTEEGGNDGADVYEAEQLWKSFEEKYMNTNTPTPGLTGSGNNHARLSPSDSKRWTQCLASIAFQEANAHRVRKDSGSTYSDAGTEAHEWAAKVLMNECAIDDVPEIGSYGDDLRIHVKDYVDHCKTQVGEGARLTSIAARAAEAEGAELLGVDPETPDHAYFVEEQVSLFYQSEQTGTADFIGIVAKNGVVERFVSRDLKFGAGVLVTNDLNSQLAIYVYSAIKMLESVYTFGPDTLIDLAVYQPRHREGAEQKPWVITLADLSTFCWDIEHHAIAAREGANKVREKIGSPGRDVSPEEILEAAPGLRFYPQEGDGGSCRWCRCKAFCPKRLSAMCEDMDTPHLSAEDLLACMPDLEKQELKLPIEDRVVLTGERLGLPVLTDEYLVTLYRRAKGIKKFLEDIEDYLEGRLLDGEEVPGIQLTMGREGNRAWANEAEAETFLKGQGLKIEERFDFKLKSPSAIEKALSEKLKTVKRTATRFQSLITRSSARRVISLADDKRPAVTSSIAAMPDIDASDDEPEFE